MEILTIIIGAWLLLFGAVAIVILHYLLYQTTKDGIQAWLAEREYKWRQKEELNSEPRGVACPAPSEDGHTLSITGNAWYGRPAGSQTFISKGGKWVEVEITTTGDDDHVLTKPANG